MRFSKEVTRLRVKFYTTRCCECTTLVGKINLKYPRNFQRLLYDILGDSNFSAAYASLIGIRTVKNRDES